MRISLPGVFLGRFRGGLGGLLVVFLALSLGVQAALAGSTVSLVSRDGSTRVEGELLNFDGKTYTLRTNLGTMDIKADQVTCEGAGCPGAAPSFDTSAAFEIAGSNVMGDLLLPALVDGFAQSLNGDLVTEVGGGRNKRVLKVMNSDEKEVAAISVDASGTRVGFPALASGKAAFAMASERLRPGEAGLRGLVGTPAERIVALDGIVVLVHQDNPVRTLSLDQIAGIFAGRIRDWAQLGGNPGPISLYVPDANSGTRAAFEEKVMKPRRMAIADSAETLDRNSDIADLVSVDRGGIGLTSFAYARAAQMVSIRLQCGLVSTPGSFEIKTEEYALSRRLYLYGDASKLSPQAQALAAYAVSDAAQPFIASAGFGDRSVERESISVQGARLANSITSPGEFSLPLFREMLTNLMDAERLSITFRFNAGKTTLETRSQSEAEEFAKMLARGDFAGKDVLLVGFADSVGDFNVNRDLAKRRAETVLESLKAAVPPGALDGVSIQVQSYGELTPVGCNETAEGRQLNRRVEVWIRDKTG